MFKNILCRYFLFVFVIFLSVQLDLHGQYYRSNNRRNNTGINRSTDSRYSREQEKMMIIQQQAESAAQKMSTDLKNILTSVNTSQKPDQMLLKDAQGNLRESGKYAPRFFSDKLKAEYYMLYSWIHYYKGEIRKAYVSSGTAVRTHESNDARATQAAMAILAGAKPMPVKTPEPVHAQGDSYTTNKRINNPMRSQRMRGRRNRPEQFQQNTMTTQKISFNGTSGNILNLNVANIGMRLLGQEIAPMDFHFQDNTTFKYTPGRHNLCLFFWSVPIEQQSYSSSGLDPNTPGTAAAPVVNSQPQQLSDRSDGYYRDSNMDPSYYNSHGSNTVSPVAPVNPAYDEGYQTNVSGGTQNSVLQPFDEFKKFYESMAANKSFKFIGINIDDLDHNDKVEAFLKRHKYQWAQTSIHTMPESIFAVAAKTIYVPSMVVVNKEGVVNYAGPADCFLPKLVLESMQPGKSLDIKTSNSPKTLSNKTNSSVQANAAVESANSRTVKPGTRKTRRNPVITDGFTAAEKYQAEQMKLNVINSYNLGRRFNNYRNTVKHYRELLAKYPDSEQTLEAREYIRKIPQLYIERLNITKEELGY